MNTRRTAACMAIACCVIVETALRWPSAFHLSYLLIPLAALAFLACLALRPAQGAWLVMMVVCVGLVSPFPMSYSFLIALVPAATTIWRDGRWPAALAVMLAITALLVDRKALFGLGVSDSVVVAFAYFLCAVALIIAAHGHAERVRLREREKRRRERERIAASLHDRATNDMVNAIMRINADLDDTGFDERQSAELRGIRDMIRHAMTATYQAIDTLDCGNVTADDAPAHAGQNAGNADAASGMHRRHRPETISDRAHGTGGSPPHGTTRRV